MRAFLIATVLGGLMACGSSDAEQGAGPTTDVGTSTPTPPADSGATASAGPKKPDPPADPKNDCLLAAMTGVAPVTPAFVVYASPNVVPPTMTGGTVAGQYAVDGAKVFLPAGTGGLVDTSQSTGSIVAWAVFDGKNYRLQLNGDFTLMTVAGPQSQSVDTESQGGFTASGSTLLLDHACDTATAGTAGYSFTEDGTGHATILVDLQTVYGETWLELEARSQ
jgi:hypothetical protein